MKLKTFIFSFIVLACVAGFFRLYKITQFPVSLTLDEVEIAYNAFSLLQTGKDAWSAPVPLVFKSVGDYKPPVNVYLTVLPIKMVGLTEWATRIPTAVMGIISVICIVILLRYLGFSRSASLVGGGVLALMPWHVHFSRAGFEAITALFFIIGGTASFIRSVRAKSYGWLWVSIVFFGLSVWAYHAPRVFTPLLFIFLVIQYWKELKSFSFSFKKMSVIIVTGAIVSLPFLYLTFFTPAIRTRAASTSILREASLIKARHEGNYLAFSQWIFDNDVFLIFHHWAGKYLNYFDVRFWFWKGLFLTPPGYPDTGLLYAADILLWVPGFIYSVTKGKKWIGRLMAFWFFAGPLPASFAQNDQHALRSLTWVPFFVIVCAAGAQAISQSRWKRLVWGLYGILLVFNIGYVADIYFLQHPRFYSEAWHYGFSDIAKFACSHKAEYEEIVISETFGSEGPTLSGIPASYVLFYCQYDPSLFQQSGQIPGFAFRRINWKSDSTKPDALLVSSPWDYTDTQIPQERVIKELKFLNGVTSFVFVETSGSLK